MLFQLHFGEITLGSILSSSASNDSETRLLKQVPSVLISLVSLTWSFTAYHRYSKLGGLRILWSLPLLFAIFFQVYILTHFIFEMIVYLNEHLVYDFVL